MTNSKPVVTGAAVYIFSRIIDAFRERYDLTLLDRARRTRAGVEIADIQIVDLTDRNRDAYRAYFQGADAVLHCAFVGRASNIRAAGETAEARSAKFQN